MTEERKSLLVVCDHYAKEVETILGSDRFRNVKMVPFSGRCGRPPVSWDKIRSTIPAQEKNTEIYLLGGCCLPNAEDAPADINLQSATLVHQCFDILVEEDFVRKSIRKGDYMVSPGWLECWRETIEEWGFDQETARDFFKESASRVMLLDTGTHDDSIAQLHDFCDFIALPGQVQPAALDRFKEVIGEIIETSQTAREQTTLPVKETAKIAELATALDMMGDLARTTSVAAAIDEINSIFTMITAAGTIQILFYDAEGTEKLHSAYPATNPVEVIDRLRVFEDDVSPLADRRGFLLSIRNGDELLAVVEVDQIPLGYNIRHYMNFGLSISKVCALAIVNARRFEKLQLAEAETKKAYARMEQAQRLEAIGTLAGGVAHDFNNMLTVLIGEADFMHDELGTGHPLRENASEILRVCNRAAELTKQLLTFGRKQIAKPRVLDLNKSLGAVQAMVRRVIGEEIEIETSYEERALPVMIDPGQMEQVVINLVVNAGDAMPGGGILSLETGTRVLDEEIAEEYEVTPGAYSYVRIGDTGTGIDEKVLPRIFEPFFTTKNRAKGSGLGLSSVYGIVRQNDGCIMVESDAEKGSTFTVCFPATSLSSGKESPLLSDMATIAPVAEATIMVVEDEPLLLKMVKRYLAGAGFEVLSTTKPQQATNMILGHPGQVDLLVTDVVMPGMNGKELADQVLQRLPNTKVLFMSGYTEDDIGDRGVLPEETNFLPKPFTKSELVDKISRILLGS